MFNEKEATTLTQELNQWKDNLIITGNLVQDHLIKKHRGLPASTCHDCLFYQDTILNDREAIAKLEKKLSELDQ